MSTEVNRISPSGPTLRERLREVWRFRALFAVCVERVIKLRFKQTLVGPVWVVLQPIMLTVVFTVVFSRVARVPSEQVPYPVFAFSGLVVWTFFSASFVLATNSLVTQQQVVSKVYFPRIILPTATVAAFVIDLVAAVAVLAVLMAVYGVAPQPTALLGLPWLIEVLVFSSVTSCWASALAVKYRDIRIVLPFFMQFALFLTPVAYPVTKVPGRFRAIYDLNPMTSIVVGFRSAVLGTPGPSLRAVVLSSGVVAVAAIVGIGYFVREERFFADVI